MKTVLLLTGFLFTANTMAQSVQSRPSSDVCQTADYMTKVSALRDQLGNSVTRLENAVLTSERHIILPKIYQLEDQIKVLDQTWANCMNQFTQSAPAACFSKSDESNLEHAHDERDLYESLTSIYLDEEDSLDASIKMLEAEERVSLLENQQISCLDTF